MKKILLACIFIVDATLQASEQKLSSTLLANLTMEEAVCLAREHRPDLESLSYAIKANKSNAKSAIAGYFPTVTLSSVESQAIGEKGLTNTTNLIANQLIYSFAGPKQLYKRAKHYTELSEVEREVQENVVRWEVERAFLQAFLIQENDQTIQSTLVTAKAIYTKSKLENKQDLLDKNEWLKRVEAYAASIADYYQFDDDIQIAFRKLELLLGQPVVLVTDKANERKPVVTHITWKHPKKIHLEPLTQYYDYAIKNRPEIRLGDKKMAIEHMNVKIAQGGRLPTITFSGQAAHQGQPLSITPVDVHALTDKSYHSFSFSLAWPLFDGAVLQHQERQAHANKIKEMLAQQQTVLNIKQEVQEKYYSLNKALLWMRAQKMSYLRSRNEYQLRQKELEIGQISPVDFQNAVSSWEKAQYDWTARNVDIALRQRDLMFSCGYPAAMENGLS